MNEHEHKFLGELETFRKVNDLSIQGFCRKIHVDRSKYYRWLVRHKSPQDKKLYNIHISVLTIHKLKELGFRAIPEKQEHGDEFERYLNDNGKAGEFFRALKYRLYHCDT